MNINLVFGLIAQCSFFGGERLYAVDECFFYIMKISPRREIGQIK